MKNKRVQLDMSESTLNFLDELKRKTNSVSRAEVIRNAMIYFDYFVDQVHDNGEIIVRKSGKEEKVILPLIPNGKDR